MKLSERALLTQLTLSVWTARKHDKQVSRQAAAAHNALEIAGRYHKALLPMSDSLDDVRRMAGTIRNYFYEQTLPWGLEGARILPSDNYLTFMSEMRKRKDDWQMLVRKFTGEYEHLVSIAPQYLGDMFSADDYPDPSVIASKFRINLEVMPVPSTDFRIDLPDEDIEDLKRGMEARLIEAQATAMKDVWQRLYTVVQKAHEKLADPNGIFRDSLIENVREVCSLLPRLNITDDPNLEDMRIEALAAIGAHDPDKLRHNTDLRSKKASETKAIMDRMSMLMGE